MSKKKLFKYIRVALSLLLIYYILTKIDLHEISRIFQQSRPYYLVPIGLMFLLEKAIETFKWKLLLRAKAIMVPFLEMLKINIIGSFLGFALPSAISVDLIRGYGLYKYISNKEESITSVVVDRILSLSMLIFIAIISAVLFIAYARVGAGAELIRLMLVSLLILLAFLGFLISVVFVDQRFFWNIIENHFAKIKSSATWMKMKRFHSCLQEYKNHTSTFVAVILLSLVLNVSRMMIYFFAALCLHLAIPWQYFLFFVPIVQLMTRLPISICGLGVREGSFVYFFSRVGLPSSAALSISFFVSILVILSVLPGGILYATVGFSKEKKESWQMTSSS